MVLESAEKCTWKGPGKAWKTTSVLYTPWVWNGTVSNDVHVMRCSSGKSLSRRHTMTGGGSGSSGTATGLTVHSWFATSALLAKCIWSTAVSQHQFYIDIRHSVSISSGFLCIGISCDLTICKTEKMTLLFIAECLIRLLKNKIWTEPFLNRVHRVLEKSLKVLEFWKKIPGPWKSLKNPWIWMFHILKFLHLIFWRKHSCKIWHFTTTWL